MDKELRICVNSSWFHFQTCDATETCDAIHHGCSCTIGEDRCTTVKQSQTCVMGGGGLNGYFDTNDCKVSESCDPAKGVCSFTPPTCATLGAYTCAPDGNTVLQCLPNAMNKLDWAPTIVCTDQGFANGCSIPPVNVASATDMCLNACNERGIKLNGELCAPAGTPGLYCAVLICGNGGATLVPDHTGCNAAGFACAFNSDCTSCLCSNGKCLGSTPELCPPIASQICQ